MRYLKAMRVMGITYGNGEENGNLIIKSYSDSNWASDHTPRKSISSFIFIVNGGVFKKTNNGGSLINRNGIYRIDPLWKRGHLVEATTNKSSLDKDGLYAKIKVTKSTGTEQINDDAAGQDREIPSSRILTSIAAMKVLANPSTSLSLKDNNQESIALAHNLVFYAQIKHINISHHYI